MYTCGPVTLKNTERIKKSEEREEVERKLMIDRLIIKKID